MKRTKKSQKKTKFLLILLVLTAILSITATYAWFSSQRDVDVTGIKLNVEVAESMQISLDGEKWYQSITIDNMRQFYGTYSVTTTAQAKSGDNTNYVPMDLLPVSTQGTVSEGKLQFMKGSSELEGTTTKATLTACSEADLTADATITTKEGGQANHPYLVFDMYLRNYSKAADDALEMNIGSRVWVSSTDAASQEGTGKEGTGLENCARVGFVVYENTADITASGDDIRDLSSTTPSAVSIWEPNSKEHITEVITAGRATADTEATTYAAAYNASGYEISDVYSSSDPNVAAQVTFKPEYDTSSGTTTKTTITDIAGANVRIKGNVVTKVRVYIWLEGQDVDCINTASQGDRLQATIKFTKETNSGDGNSYAGDPTTTTGS